MLIALIIAGITASIVFTKSYCTSASKRLREL
jgi:hypothetical protein